MKKEESIKLADGRIVLRGPWIDGTGYWKSEGRFNVRIYVISPAMLQHSEKYGDSIIILEVKIYLSYIGTINLPEIKLMNQELWTKDLVTQVARTLRQSKAASSQETEYVVAKLSRMFEKDKELILGDGRRLVGDLQFNLESDKESSAGHENLQVWGNVKDPKTEGVERINLFTVKHLFTLSWPYTSRQTPTYVKNKEVWCKKLEFLVINYLNLLVGFATQPLEEQMAKIVTNLVSHSEWAVICQAVFQKLLSFDPDLKDDQRVAQALELINEVS